MILDKIENADRYAGLHPLFQEAFDFLKDVASKPLGKYEIDGENLFVMVSDNKLRNNAEMEAHKRYIDIQLVIDGTEKFLCAPVSQCQNISKPYVEESDIMFFSDKPSVEYSAPKGTISIFFPEDAHAPLIGDGDVRKAIAKVKLI